VHDRVRHAILALGAPLLALVLAAGVVQPALGAPSATVVAHGDPSQPAVALTFDDDLDAAATRAIFAILTRERVPATFFPLAPAVAQDPLLWRSIADAGYPIGNHTTTHADLTTVDSDRITTEIAGARRTIERAIGRPSAPLFRPPFGRLDARVAQVAGSLGYRTVVLWDTASSDWLGVTPADVTADSLAGGSGCIVLLHAGPAATIAALPAIIAGYRARGIRLVTVPELLRQ